MFHSHMELGNQPQKLTQDITLLQNEKCIIKATAGTLTLPILIDKKTSGNFFIGKGEFTLDAIIETTRGAIGKPIARNLNPNQPYLMLGENTNLNQNLAPATTQDLTNMGYQSTEEFLKTANNTFDQFAHRRHGHINIKENSRIFAFATEHNTWDILIAKTDKLVYTSKHRVYISRDNGESVSLGPTQILVAKKGKTVVIGNGNILVDRDDH
jgi:hypothetical protein